MRKSGFIQLVLISLFFASCKDETKTAVATDRLFIRTDTTTNFHAYPAIFYYRFLTSASYSKGTYRRGSYYSYAALPHRSVRRGGFGRGYSGRA